MSKPVSRFFYQNFTIRLTIFIRALNALDNDVILFQREINIHAVLFFLSMQLREPQGGEFPINAVPIIAD